MAGRRAFTVAALLTVQAVEPRGTGSITVGAEPAGRAGTGTGDVVARRSVNTPACLTTPDTVQSGRTFYKQTKTDLVSTLHNSAPAES